MFKILVVDDEKSIREVITGIKNPINTPDTIPNIFPNTIIARL